MILIQKRDVGFDLDEVEKPELVEGETFGDDAVTDSSWTVFTMHETALDALASFVACINSDEVDDVNFYYRVVDTQTGEIRGL